MKFLDKFFLAILLVFNLWSFSAQDTLYSFGADNSYIELLDSTNFDTLGYIPLSSDIGLVEGVNGVDSDPCGQIYIIFKTDQTDDRNLGIVDLLSGVITNRGVLSDKIANITISSDGTIYGVTGDGADNPEILYTINPITAVLTYLDSLGNGDDGESIEYCPDNNKIYHWSGWGSGDFIMESIDLLTLVKDSIVLTGVGSDLIQNVGASTYAGNGEFICFDVNEELYFRIDTLGYVSDSIEPIGNDYVKGLVFQEGNFNVPSVNITPNDSILTCNESILISGARGGTLQWFYNNRAIIGANSNSIYASRHGEYNQSKTNLNGCTNFGSPIHIIDTCPRTAYAFPAWEIGNDTTSVLEAVNSQTLDSLYTIGLSSILGNVIGVNGADTDPCGIPFLVYKIDNDVDTNGYQIRRLGVLDLTNGAILDRGPLSDKIANLTFSSNGTLYGVTGDGADNPEVLYTINPTSAIITYLDSLGNGDDGESIEYCPDDNNIYHWSGWGSGDVIMEKINLTTFSVQSINLHGLGVDEIENVGSSTYSGYGEFLCFDVNEELYFRIDTSGYVSSPIFPLGIDEGIKGLFFLEGQNFNDAVEVNVSICNGDSLLLGGSYQTSAGNYSDTLSNSLGCDSVVNTVLAIYYSNTGTDTQTACDSLTWIDGVTYTANNNAATHTLTNAAGCDSVVTLDLTINYSTSGTDVITACDSYTWIDGITYLASNNSATYTIQNNGSSSQGIQFEINSPSSLSGPIGFTTNADPGVSPQGWTLTPNLNLPSNSINAELMMVEDGSVGTNPQGNPISQEGCFPLINDLTGKIAVIWRNTCQFGEKILNAERAGAIGAIIINRVSGLVNMAPSDSGALCTIPAVFIKNSDGAQIVNEMQNGPVTVFIGTIPNGNAAGCDSVVTLDLTINNSSSGIDVQTACDSLTWIDGVTYIASNNTATYTLTNSAGCDSVLTLDLTINYSNAGSSSVVACDSYTWAIDGNTYTASGTYNNVTTNVAGCTHTETLNLTINNSNSGTDTQTACDSYTWIDGVTYTSNNNTATHTLTNVAGCDSVVTLNLTINPIIANIVQNGNDIEASATNGAAPYSYDWSTGETTTSITPAANGPYWVVVSDIDNCFSDSATFDVTFVSGTGVKNWNNSVSVYPNPTSDIFTISTGNYTGALKVNVYDLFGRKVFTSNDKEISLKSFADGVYILEFKAADKTYTTRIIKE